jgi:hypothetical protein
MSEKIGNASWDGAVNTGIFAFGGPQFAILIPAILPIVAFIANKVEERCAYKAESG